MYVILSTDIEKVFDEIKHLFMVKYTRKIRYRRKLPSIVKAIRDKLIANVMLNEEILKSFPLRSGTRQ
jgi:hypothetical protein